MQQACSELRSVAGRAAHATDRAHRPRCRARALGSGRRSTPYRVVDERSPADQFGAGPVDE